MNNNRTTKIFFIILIFLVGINIYLTIKDRGLFELRIKNQLADIRKDIKEYPNEYKDGYTPVKGKDYFDGSDGRNGRDGRDSKSTHTIEKETVIKQQPVNGKDGKDGKTPILRCNNLKNRWEISYINDYNWTYILDNFNNPVKCIIDVKE